MINGAALFSPTAVYRQKLMPGVFWRDEKGESTFKRAYNYLQFKSTKEIEKGPSTGFGNRLKAQARI
jgi:hypothetical protein